MRLFLFGIITALALVVICLNMTTNPVFLCGILWGIFFTAIFVIAWECMVINLITRYW